MKRQRFFLAAVATFALGALSGGVYVKLSGKIFNDGFKSRRSDRFTAADFANFSGIRYYDAYYLEQEPYFAEVKRANSLRNLAAISVAMARYAHAHDGCWPPPYSTDADGKKPTQAEFKSEFELKGTWAAIHKYMGEDSMNALDRANKVIIFE